MSTLLWATYTFIVGLLVGLGGLRGILANPPSAPMPEDEEI